MVDKDNLNTEVSVDLSSLKYLLLFKYVILINRQSDEQAVGVMCLNSTVNYELLQDMYELRPYFGLVTATAKEKEHLRQHNSLMETFG